MSDFQISQAAKWEHHKNQTQVCVSIEKIFAFVERARETFETLNDGLENLWSELAGDLTEDEKCFCRGYQAARMDCLYRYALVSLVEADLGSEPLTWPRWVWKSDQGVTFG